MTRKRKSHINTILITGGTGQIGRELRNFLPNARYIASTDCNLTCCLATHEMIKEIRPNVVIHTAARVGGIVDNIKHQTEYYSDNVLINTNLINSCLKHDVSKFIGVLSTCIYPDTVNIYPMNEDVMHNGSPTKTNFSYGIAKRGMGVHIDSIRNQYGKSYCYTIPCNLYGIHDKYNDRSHFVAALLKKIHLARINGETKIMLYGTGAPLRQVLYAKDLANILASMVKDDLYENFNIASPDNLTIHDIARVALDSLGLNHFEIEYDNTMPDGQYRKDVCINKFKSYFPNFQFTSLSDGIKEVYAAVFRNI